MDISNGFLFFLSEIPKNISSGLTVALVNIPLSITLAIAGGAGPVPGIVTAFWCGLICALFGGSEFNIVGPTEALSGILAVASLKLSPTILPWLSVWSGILTLLLWRLDLVDYLLFIPSSVIQGFTLGVAIIIGLGQLDFSIGLEIHHDKTTEFYQKFLILVGIRKYPKMPWNIILCVFGGLIGYAGSIIYIWAFSDLVTVAHHFEGVDLSLRFITFPTWSDEVYSYSVISSAASCAFIGILETLISARLADVMTHTDHNKLSETAGLGLANIVGGAFGGFPATAARARMSLNVQSGATSRVSALINAIVLFMIAYVIILPYFSYVPMSTIGAILVIVAYRMIDVNHLVHIFKYEKSHFLIAMITALICVFVDTMAGLVAGALLSLLIYARTIADGHVEIKIVCKHSNYDQTGHINSNTSNNNDLEKDDKNSVTYYVDVPKLDSFELKSEIMTRFDAFIAHRYPFALGTETESTKSDKFYNNNVKDEIMIAKEKDFLLQKQNSNNNVPSAQIHNLPLILSDYHIHHRHNNNNNNSANLAYGMREEEKEESKQELLYFHPSLHPNYDQTNYQQSNN
eukprot:gene15538-20979_t